LDAQNIQTLVRNGQSSQQIAAAQRTAKRAWPPFPHNGCAANLSALLQMSGVSVPMTLGAGKLAHLLRDSRLWAVVGVGSQMAGDVGVTYDDNNIPGADHVYLVIQDLNGDEMIISDNQSTTVHHRFASGKGKTKTEYFLRAT